MKRRWFHRRASWGMSIRQDSLGKCVILWPPSRATPSDIPYLAFHTWGAKTTCGASWPAGSGDVSAPGLSSGMTSLDVGLMIYKIVLGKITLKSLSIPSFRILRDGMFRLHEVGKGHGCRIYWETFAFTSFMYVDSCSSHVSHSLDCSCSLEAILKPHVFIEASWCLE